LWRASCASFIAVCLTGAASAADDGQCEPWPGEFTPLPTIHSTDPFAAHWASLRLRELSRLAQDLEAEDPIEAHRLWRRVRCLDPQSVEAEAALARTRPSVVVHRASTPLPPVAAPAPASDRMAMADDALRHAEKLLYEARFRAAVDAAAALRDDLASLGDAPGARERRVKLGILEGTAWVALREEAAARASFGRALAEDPGLTLDAQSTAPKVRRAFEAARTSLARRDG
jgi:hypothetical protein